MKCLCIKCQLIAVSYYENMLSAVPYVFGVMSNVNVQPKMGVTAHLHEIFWSKMNPQGGLLIRNLKQFL